MTEQSAQMIIESINNRIDSLDVSINKRIDSLDLSINKRIDSLEDRMNDRFVLLEAKFITRLDKEIGNLSEATAKGFAEQESKFQDLENKMNTGFSMVDHKISSLQDFYHPKSVFKIV